MGKGVVKQEQIRESVSLNKFLRSVIDPPRRGLGCFRCDFVAFFEVENSALKTYYLILTT